MIETVLSIFAIALLVGYIKLQQGKGKEYPLSSKVGKHKLAMLIMLPLLVIATGILFALAEGQTKRQQITLLIIILSGPVAALTGLAFVSIRSKFRSNKKNNSAIK